MLIAINIFIVIFLLAMIYWFGAQGVFSALLHLCAVLAAATVAFAIWEPVTYALMGVKAQFAWGVGLLAPFGLLLLGFRYGIDKLVPGNLKFAPLVDFIGGGALGLISAVLTAGMVLIGAGLLPMGTMWYQALVVSADAGVHEREGLWLPVDRWTTGVFNGLSVGAFSSGAPLAYYNPDLARQVHLIRLGFDQKASIVAVPGSVEVEGVYVQPTPVSDLSPAVASGLGEGFKSATNRLVVVDTAWSPDAGTIDIDMTTRIPPTQVRLVTQTTTGSRINSVQLHAPLAVSQEATGGGDRIFRPFESDRVFAFTTKQENLGWAFVVPEDQEPKFLLVRNLRLMLPEPSTFETQVDPLKDVLGFPAEESAAADAGDGENDDRSRSSDTTGQTVRDGVQIEQTNRLPHDISKNTVPSLRYDSGDPQMIVEGQDVSQKPSGRIGQNTRAIGIYMPSHKAMIRVRLDRQAAHDLLGVNRASAARQQPVTVGSVGVGWEPIAYVLAESNQTQNIRVSLGNPITNAEELPVSEMPPDSNLYLYFMVDRGITLRQLKIGGQTIDIDVRTE